jgi:hypothetical protein
MVSESSIVVTCSVIRYIPEGTDLQSYLSDTLHLKRILRVLKKLSFRKVKYLGNVSRCVCVCVCVWNTKLCSRSGIDISYHVAIPFSYVSKLDKLYKWQTAAVHEGHVI